MATAAPPDKPNIVFILIDDMGWRDVGCFGSTFYRTPNIDRLAGEGMKFTNAYAACPVCSPTRASILTGKYPARLHVTDWIPGFTRQFAKLKSPAWTQYLSTEEITLADVLKPAGYISTSIGKWHLGDERYWPEKHGFDSNFGGTHQGQPPSYFSPYRIANIPNGPEGEYLTDRLADQAVKFIETNKDKPFFLYLPHYAVHGPHAAKADMIAQYEGKVSKKAPQHNPTYAAMVQSVDESVGKVCGALHDLGLEQRTIVIFTSDNGGLEGPTSNEPLREGKGTLYEGGIREPMIVKWPGVVKAGAVCDSVVSSVDFYPTILEVAGVADKPGHVRDGLSILPLLKQTGAVSRDAIYWHYPHYHHTTPGGAIRVGDFKLIEYYEDNRCELYNLKDDLSETTDLSAAMPQKVQEYRQKLAAWRNDVGAQMPMANPNYDPAKDKAKKALAIDLEDEAGEQAYLAAADPR